MIVDFHTHAFPENIAERALSGIVANSRIPVKPFADGTTSGLLQSMDNAGVDISVVAPIATKPTQTENLNKWAASIASDRLFCFGSIFPTSDSYKEDIDLVISHGLHGIKLHAEYQKFVPDSVELMRVYDYAFSKNLVILQHGGEEYGTHPPCRSNPKMWAEISKTLGGGKMVIAHLGGVMQTEEVLEHIVGTNLYIDTSQGFDYYTEKQFEQVVKAHGAHKILFGSDSPWGSPKYEIDKIKNTSLSNDEKEMIFSGTFLSIFNI